MTDKKQRPAEAQPVVSSVRVEGGPAHDRVHVWSRGGKAGEFVVSAGEGQSAKVAIQDKYRVLVETSVPGVRWKVGKTMSNPAMAFDGDALVAVVMPCRFEEKPAPSEGAANGPGAAAERQHISQRGVPRRTRCGQVRVFQRGVRGAQLHAAATPDSAETRSASVNKYTRAKTVGNPIVTLGARYLVWSTIVDAPVSYGMTLAELEKYVREEDGRRGVDELGRRLQRVALKGTSAFDDKDADDTIRLNRAGPDEEPLHREEIVEFYVRQRVGRPTKKALAGFRKGLPRCGPKCPSRLDENGCGGFCRRCWGTDYVRATHGNSKEDT